MAESETAGNNFFENDALGLSVPVGIGSKGSVSWQELDRMDWHLWVLGHLVVLVLGVGVLSFMFPATFWFSEELSISAPQRTFVGFCILLSLALAYLIQRQTIVRRLRGQLFHAMAALYGTELRAATQVFLALPNIEEFRDMLAMHFRRAGTSNEPLGVALVRIEGASEVEMGHAACLLISVLRQGQTLFRISADSLAAILPGKGLTETKSTAGEAMMSLAKQAPNHDVNVIATAYPEEAATVADFEARLKLWAPTVPPGSEPRLSV
jgi:GGDEF domain-containing protein